MPTNIERKLHILYHTKTSLWVCGFYTLHCEGLNGLRVFAILCIGLVYHNHHVWKDSDEHMAFDSADVVISPFCLVQWSNLPKNVLEHWCLSMTYWLFDSVLLSPEVFPHCPVWPPLQSFSWASSTVGSLMKVTPGKLGAQEEANMKYSQPCETETRSQYSAHTSTIVNKFFWRNKTDAWMENQCIFPAPVWFVSHNLQSILHISHFTTSSFPNYTSVWRLYGSITSTLRFHQSGWLTIWQHLYLNSIWSLSRCMNCCVQTCFTVHIFSNWMQLLSVVSAPTWWVVYGACALHS